VISGIQTTTPFSLVPPPALPLLVPPGASVSLAVRYAPAATVTVTTNLTLVVNTAAGRLNVPVSGSGYYAISLGTAPAASGSASGGGSFPSGSTCTVTAVANTGYVFEDWTENSVVVSTSPSYVFTVQSNRSLVANFIAASVQLSPVYRFWSALHSGHFFTISEWEKNHIQATWPDIWSYEGVAWYALTTPATNASPVYRFWSPVYSRHFFTISEAEKNYIRTNWPDIWTYESVAWYAFPTEAPGSSPVYRFWSPLYNGHFFTVSEAEKNHIQATWPDIWSYEGIAYYVYSSAPTPTSLQRLAVPEGEKDGPAVASQDSSGTETLRRATPSAVFALKPMESAEINVSPPAEVTFALAYGADKEVTAALYDPVTNGFQAILATRLSPREIELPRLLPDRRYWICILARDTGVQDWTLDYGGWLGRLAERPETDVPVLTGKKADMLGLPIEHIVLPHSDEAINIRIYDGHDNRLIETISELQDGTIYDFNVPAWNQWFRVEVETATSKTVLQAFWIGHLRTH